MRVYPNYKKFSGKWIDRIPIHWNEVSLRRISEFLYGDSLSKDNRVEGDVPVFGSNGVVGYHNHPLTKSPCIIIGRKGSFGKVTYSESECFPIDTTYYIDETVTNNNLRWIFYLLQFLRLDAYSKDSAVPGLSREDAYSRKAPILPHPEQQAIADFLDHKTTKIDALIAQKQRKIELLQEYRTAVINQAVTKGLDPNVPMKDSGVEWLGLIPAHWNFCQLKFLAEKIGSGITPKGGANNYLDSGIPFIRSQNVHFEGLNISDIAFISNGIHQSMDNSIVYPHDVLINITGASIGRCTYVPTDFPESNVNQHVCIIRPNGLVNHLFLNYFLSSNFGQIQVQLGMTGAARDGLNYANLSNFLIPLPTYEEQLEITRMLSEQVKNINSLLYELSVIIEYLKEYRTALISEAVTGKIDVRNWKGEKDGIPAYHS